MTYIHKNTLLLRSLTETTHSIKWKWSNLERILTCKRCSSTIDDPRFLKCQHAFCYSCIKDDWSVASELDRAVTCFICGDMSTLSQEEMLSLEKFDILGKLRELLDSKKRMYTCIGCKSMAPYYCQTGCGPLCPKCLEEHNHFHLNKLHTVV